LDISLEVLQRDDVFLSLLHQIGFLSDKLGVFLGQLLFSKFPLFLRHLKF
jgi:hypothetical protein